MATLYKREIRGGYVYYVTYSYQGRRYRKSLETSDRKLAELFLKDLEVKIARDKLGFGDLNHKQMLLSEFIKEYLNHSKAVKADKTYQIDKSSLQQFMDFVEDIWLSRITIKHGEDFKIKRLQEIKPASVNIRLRSIKAAFEKAVKWGYIEKNPFKDIKQCRVDSHPEFFTKEDIQILLKTIPEGVFKQFVIFCLYTGCRRNEALNLTWDDIDVEKGEVTFRITKTGKSRIVSFNGVLNDLFRKMERKEERPFPFYSSFVTHKFKKYLRASGIKNAESLKLHSTRHTYISHALMAGIDIITVEKQVGHSSTKVTETYAHLIPDHVKASIEKLHY